VREIDVKERLRRPAADAEGPAQGLGHARTLERLLETKNGGIRARVAAASSVRV
jgi:hypothetical protein